MYHIEKEIENQFGSIKKTVDYIYERRNEISSFFSGETKIRFVGSGSSYYVAQSAATIFRLNNAGFDTFFVAAGDFIQNFNKYRNTFEGSIVVFLTRSGSTSEVINSILLLKDTKCKKVAVCAKKDAETAVFCDLNLEIEWAFDKSVCQTQTVSNLYSACLAMSAVINGDDSIIEDLRSLESHKDGFSAKYETALKEIGESESWDSAVTLADCECAGLFTEAALAFLEICQNKSSFYHVLDVRHGPIVMVDDKTLVILLAAGDDRLYKDLVRDLKGKGAFCITAGMFAEGLGGDMHIELPRLSNLSVSAVFALYAIHIITFSKAISKGVNPDGPEGLDPWIELK